MARNRKRRNDRRPRRPADAGARPGVATARAAREEPGDGAARAAREEPSEALPEALEHAAPDVELAEAQLAVGRPELSEVDDDLADDAERLTESPGAGGGGAGDGGSDWDGGDEDDDLAPVPASGATPARRPGLKLVHFLQGSWRELQRVQWPDRRQVMQATGVVIGFVIVAGAFLGVADFVATKVVHFILQ